jgi:hypothetical protein
MGESREAKKWIRKQEGDDGKVGSLKIKNTMKG